MAHSFVAFLFVVVEQDDEELGGDQGVFIGQGKKALDFLPTRGVLGSGFFPFNLMKA
jgi:hypothetical protein